MQSDYLNLQRDISGIPAYAPSTANYKWSATLDNGDESHFTVPANYSYWIAVFSYQPGANVWVDLTGATAALPAGATFAATTAELNPGSRYVAAGTKISAITDNSTTDVGVSLYAVAYP